MESKTPPEDEEARAGEGEGRTVEMFLDRRGWRYCWEKNFEWGVVVFHIDMPDPKLFSQRAQIQNHIYSPLPPVVTGNINSEHAQVLTVQPSISLPLIKDKDKRKNAQ